MYCELSTHISFTTLPPAIKANNFYSYTLTLSPAVLLFSSLVVKARFIFALDTTQTTLLVGGLLLSVLTSSSVVNRAGLAVHGFILVILGSAVPIILAYLNDRTTVASHGGNGHGEPQHGGPGSHGDGIDAHSGRVKM